MDEPAYERFEPSVWRASAVALAAAAAGAAIVAGQHIWATIQRGYICGQDQGGHCWACYAAPLLGFAALAAWRAHPSRKAAAARARS